MNDTALSVVIGFSIVRIKDLPLIIAQKNAAIAALLSLAGHILRYGNSICSWTLPNFCFVANVPFWGLQTSSPFSTSQVFLSQAADKYYRHLLR
jgi:hypothetical protein